MEGPNSPSLYQHLVSSSFNVHTASSTIVPITEAFQTLSKIDTNGDASVASDKIYDEIDELKFEIKTRATTEVVIANTRPTKPTRSSFLSKFLSFHRNSPRSISQPNQCQTLKSPPQEDPIPSTSPRAMDISMCDNGIADSNSQFNSRPAASDLTGQICARPYDWPHDGSLNKFTTALVIIDMQKDFASNEGYLAHQGIDNQPILDIVPKVRKLLDVCRANDFPVYHTREGHRADLSTLSDREKFRSRNNETKLGIGSDGPLGRLLIRGERGHEIIDELTPTKDEPIIDKPGRSAFQHTDFGLLLNIKGIKNLIFCGVTTDVCVTSTMREANDNNFDCVLVKDACAAGVSGHHESAVESITEEGGIFGAVTTMHDILAKMGTMKKQTSRQDITLPRKSSVSSASLKKTESQSCLPSKAKARRKSFSNVSDSIGKNHPPKRERGFSWASTDRTDVPRCLDNGDPCYTGRKNAPPNRYIPVPPYKMKGIAQPVQRNKERAVRVENTTKRNDKAVDRKVCNVIQSDFLDGLSEEDGKMGSIPDVFGGRRRGKSARK